MPTDFNQGFHTEEGNPSVKIVEFLKHFSSKVTEIVKCKSVKGREDLCNELDQFVKTEMTQGLFAPEIVETESKFRKLSDILEQKRAD